MKTKYLSFAVLLLAVFLFLLTSFSGRYLHFCYTSVSYYCVFTLFIFWAVLMVNYAHRKEADLPSLLKRFGGGFAFSLLIAVVIFVSAKPYFRVLSDEANLLSVSKSMVYEKTIDNVTMGSYYFFNYHPISRVEPIRPLLFPFLGSLVHTLSGYRPGNLFVVNFLLLLALFCGVYAFLSKYVSPATGLAGVLFVAAQPVLAQAAASAGFDLLFVVFAFICFICLYLFLKDPDRETFQLLWVNLLMLANTRYEAPLYLLVVTGLLLLYKKIKPGYFGGLLFYATPFVMLPVFWQRISVNLIPEAFSEGGYLSVAQLIRHSMYFMRSLVDIHYYFPYATVLNVTGVIAAVYFFYQMARDKWPGVEPFKQLAWTTLACFSCYWLVVSSFFAGDPLYPSTSRYFGLAAFALSLLSAVFISRLRLIKENGALAVAAGAVMFLIYNPLTVENRFSNVQYLTREYRYETDFLKKQGSKNIMIISERPVHFTVLDYGSVNFQYARQEQNELLGNLERHLFEHIYVFQSIDYNTRAPLPEDALPAGFIMRTISQLQNSSDNFIRISEVERYQGVMLPSPPAKQ